MSVSTDSQLSSYDADKEFRCFDNDVLSHIYYYLNMVCSVQIDFDWLYEKAELLIPKIKDKSKNNLTEHILEFFNDILTKLDKPLTTQQNKDLFTIMTDSIHIFSNYDYTNVCECCDKSCKKTCGLLDCGCIDSCSCPVYRDYHDYHDYD
jgi:hypothetical protein